MTYKPFEINRRFKFRAWDKTLKKYVTFLPQFLFTPELYVIQQYTGVEDKNGVEIYEGDILYVNGSAGSPYFVVVFSDLDHYQIGWQLFRVDMGVQWTLGDEKSRRHLVSGNTYENRDLLGDRLKELYPI